MARFEIPEGWTARAYRFALDPTPTQARALASHAGAARFAHNHMLALVKAVMDQRAAERSYGIPEDQLTPTQGWSLPALRKTWNQRKVSCAPWWGENSKEAVQHRPRRAGEGLGCVVGVAARPARRPLRWVPSIQDLPNTALGAVHHRCHPVRGRPPPHQPSAARRCPYPRVDPQAGPPHRSRDRADPVGHRASRQCRALALRAAGDGRS